MTAHQREASAVKLANSSIVHANVELWIHLGGLLSIEEASQSLLATPQATFALFSYLALGNLLRASIIQWRHAASLLFLN